MNEKKTKKQITLEEILIWIIENSKNQDAMDKISTTTFPYTSKYKNIYDRKKSY